MDQGKFDDAIAYFDKAILIDRNYSASWFNKGNALHFLGRYRESIDCYDKFLALDPNNANAAFAWLFAGINFDKMGNHRDAITLYKMHYLLI